MADRDPAVLLPARLGRQPGAERRPYRGRRRLEVRRRRLEAHPVPVVALIPLLVSINTAQTLDRGRSAAAVRAAARVAPAGALFLLPAAPRLRAGSVARTVRESHCNPGVGGARVAHLGRAAGGDRFLDDITFHFGKEKFLALAGLAGLFWW